MIMSGVGGSVGPPPPLAISSFNRFCNAAHNTSE